jgi:guanidinopropionase
MSISNFQPLDSGKVPRFAGPSTFMRLPIAKPEEVDIALIGIPFDGGTTNRTGARHGPREIRNQSSLVRRVHHVTGISPFDQARVADCGDVPVNPLDPNETLENVSSFIEGVRGAGTTPLTAGGDHLISLPILRGLARGKPLGMIHFDAHSDTYDSFFGSRYNHGTPFRRAIEENLLDPKPSIAPGTGTPEIGGMTTREAQKSVRMLDGLDIAGADLVEVSPPLDPTGGTALTAATLMFELLCVLAGKRRR